MKKMLSMLLTLCLAFGFVAGASAQTVADFEALVPLMDLVCATSQYAPADESVPGAEGMLSASFVDTFFKVGQACGAEVGVTAAMLDDTAAQAELLQTIFAAQLPQLSAVAPAEDLSGYIGFQPVTVNTGTDGVSVQIIGEIYVADKPMRDMSETDYANVSWPDRAVFTFQHDESAMNGFRLTGFSVGTDLNYEAEFQGYSENIVVEYADSNLGFTLDYPAVFTDDLLDDDDQDNGVSATLPDGSASFFAKRMENANAASLADYVSIVSNGITGSKATVNEEMQYGTVSYITDEGYVVFDVFYVTEQYIYQAELSYQTTRMAEFSMYHSYLENSFVVTELSQG